MSSKKLIYLFFAIVATLLIAGCEPCDVAGHESFVIDQDLPADGSIISSLTPDFEWQSGSFCIPDNFLISMDGIGNGYYDYAEVPGSDFSYTWHDSLTPGGQYQWRMRVNRDMGGSSPYTPYWTFYIGPECTTEALVAPVLESPGGPWYGAWITHNDLQAYRWSYPGSCLPVSYDYEFATDAAFTTVVDSGTTPDHQMFVEKTFPNCSTIFWRVRANDGSSPGPWSDPYTFHWVRAGTDCYQIHYLSDDAARIYVRLYSDQCTQTGYNATSVSITDPGCVADDISSMIIADGERNSPEYHMGGFEVGLGSGPCPSTGLDLKKSVELPFNVVGPGTYCISITRDQTLDHWPGHYLMDGIWTEPRTDETVAYQTVEVPPLTSDIMVQFGWDENDLFFIMPEFDFTMACRFCPDPIGPVTGFLFAEQPLPVFGRDYQSDWKLSAVEGRACYVQLSDLLIDQALAKFEGMQLRSADLEQYPAPPPCPEPDKPDTPQTTGCAVHQDSAACKEAGCYWFCGGSSCWCGGD